MSSCDLLSALADCARLDSLGLPLQVEELLERWEEAEVVRDGDSSAVAPDPPAQQPLSRPHALAVPVFKQPTTTSAPSLLIRSSMEISKAICSSFMTGHCVLCTNDGR